MSSTKTVPSPYPYHHVIIAKDQKSVTLCVYSGDGYGGYKHHRVDANGDKEVDGIIGDHFFQDYWMDYVDTDIGRNIYKTLDKYVKIEDNVVELNFNSDDIPF
jgi:hypothetical protein